MKDLVEYIATSLVDDVNAVSVTELPDGGVTVLQLYVASDEVGRVIGREGKVANAMRILLRIAGIKARKRYVLEIGD